MPSNPDTCQQTQSLTLLWTIYHNKKLTRIKSLNKLIKLDPSFNSLDNVFPYQNLNNFGKQKEVYFLISYDG